MPSSNVTSVLSWCRVLPSMDFLLVPGRFSLFDSGAISAIAFATARFQRVCRGGCHNNRAMARGLFYQLVSNYLCHYFCHPSSACDIVRIAPTKNFHFAIVVILPRRATATTQLRALTPNYLYSELSLVSSDFPIAFLSFHSALCVAAPRLQTMASTAASKDQVDPQKKKAAPTPLRSILAGSTAGAIEIGASPSSSRT